MDNRFIKEVLRQAPFGYAYHKLLLNGQGQPADYVFLDINPAFEEMTGLNGPDIIGKKATEALPGIRDGSFDWVEFYGQITLSGQKQELSQYSQPLERWYKITAFSPEKDHFVTLFQEISHEMAQIQALKNKNTEIERISSDQRLIFDSTQDAMFLARVDDNGEIRYIMNNAAHQELIGYTTQEVKDKTPEEVLGQEMGQSLKLSYLKVLEEKRPIQLEETLAFRKGERTWHTVITPVLEDGVVKYIVGSRKDITLQKKAEEEKERLFQRLQAMFSGHMAVMLLIEPESGRILDANPSACQYYGYTREEIQQLRIEDINTLPKEEVEKLRLMAAKEKQKYFIFPHRMKSGEIRFVDVYSCPVAHNGEKLLYSIIFDVTDREKYKSQLYQEKEFLRTTLYSIGDGVVTTDKEGRITLLNKAAEEITGWGTKEAEGQPFSQVFKLINEDTGQEVEDPVSKVLQKGKVIGLANHTVLINKDEQQIPIADSAAPIKDDKDQLFGVVMVFRDVTREKEQQDEILYLSRHDHLTGLFNRRFMEEEIKGMDNAGQLPLAIIMGDVNGLKLTNDVFGHEAGDMLLRKAAEKIKESCRKEDIVVRWGGDEFLIMLPRTTPETAERIIQRIKESCSAVSEGTMQLSVSFGCAVKTKEEDNLQHILKEAEEWMYHQKLMEGKSYRNTIINILLTSLFEKSMETEEHAERLKDYCNSVGEKLKCSAKELQELTLLAILHDIGKIGIRESILQKPGPLTPEEWEEMRKHPEIGYRIAQNTPELSNVAEYILFHHERWDGEGYPRGLKGEEIPLQCRILAVVDAYDAMTSDRFYRKAMSKKAALTELENNAGTQFDPLVVNTFLPILAVKHN